MKVLLHLIEKDSDEVNLIFFLNIIQIKREAAWVISNATHKGHHQDIYMLVTKYKILDYFVALLESKDTISSCIRIY